jgi:hypothetical protein
MLTASRTLLAPAPTQSPNSRLRTAAVCAAIAAAGYLAVSGLRDYLQSDTQPSFGLTCYVWAAKWSGLQHAPASPVCTWVLGLEQAAASWIQ